MILDNLTHLISLIFLLFQSGEEGEEGIRSGEPNQFDNLCDGVLGCLALVHASLQEVGYTD